MSDKVIPVRVGVRIRPMSEKEEDEGCQQIAQVWQLLNVVHLNGFSDPVLAPNKLFLIHIRR